MNASRWSSLPSRQSRKQSLRNCEFTTSPNGARAVQAATVPTSASKRILRPSFTRRVPPDIEHDKERVFLLSTTHGAETHALAAAIATMRVYQENDVVERLHQQGTRLKAGADEVIAKHGMSEYVRIIGRPCCLVFATHDRDGEPSQEFRTLFMQELIRRGVLGPSFVVSYSHSDADIDQTIAAIDGAVGVYARAMEEGAGRYLIGPATKGVYRRYN